MDPAFFLTAFLLGLAGSLHCVGMCGPLILALPFGGGAVSMAVYHGGRVLSYAGLGLAFGLLGKGIALAGLQQALAVLAGVILLLAALRSRRFEPAAYVPGLQFFTARVREWMGDLLRRRPRGGVFALGMLNGLLPCGMVYVALAGAISTAGTAAGAVFMLTFGLGTLPLLWVFSVFGQKLRSAAYRARWQGVQRVLLLAAGLLLLHRGLHLDLSLFEAAVPAAGADCH